MPNTPIYLVTARPMREFARQIDQFEPLRLRFDRTQMDGGGRVASITTNWRRAWFDYLRESGNGFTD